MKLALALLLTISSVVGCFAEDDTKPRGVVRAVRSIMQIFEDGDAHKAYMIVVPVQWATGSGVVDGRHGKITGKELKLQSKAVTVYGWVAVPELVNWVDHDDPAVRYIAAQALIEITGEKPVFWFHQDGPLEGDEKWVKNAKDTWLGWFEKLTSSKTDGTPGSEQGRADQAAPAAGGKSKEKAKLKKEEKPRSH